MSHIRATIGQLLANSTRSRGRNVAARRRRSASVKFAAIEVASVGFAHKTPNGSVFCGGALMLRRRRLGVVGCDMQH